VRPGVSPGRTAHFRHNFPDFLDHNVALSSRALFTLLLTAPSCCSA